MSKLFETLQRMQGALPGLNLSALTENQEIPEPKQAPASVAPAEPVQGGVSEAGKGEASKAEVPNIRTLPLQIRTSSPIFPFDGTHGYASEQYRILRTRLIQHPKQPHMIVVSSAGPRDGKSTTAMNVAGALALKSDARVLLMDADFRRSTVHQQLGLPDTPGLADVLHGICTLEEAMIRVEQIPNLCVVTAGRPQLNPTELLDSPQWAALCQQLRKKFKYIVIDSPPIGTVADYDLLQAVGDGVIMIARPDHTNRQLCLDALSVIPKDKLLGVVLNSTVPWPFDRQHYYSSYYTNFKNVPTWTKAG